MSNTTLGDHLSMMRHKFSSIDCMVSICLVRKSRQYLCNDSSPFDIILQVVQHSYLTLNWLLSMAKQAALMQRMNCRLDGVLLITVWRFIFALCDSSTRRKKVCFLWEETSTWYNNNEMISELSYVALPCCRKWKEWRF